MRVGDRVEHVEEEAEARLDPERVLVAVAVDGLAVDVLEDEVRLAAGETPASMRCAMCGMRQAGEDGALALEALFAGAADQRDVQQLDRRLPSKRPSQRSASQTLPVPPWPISETSR